MKKNLVTLLFLSLFFISYTAHGQQAYNQAQLDALLLPNIYIEMTPEFPGPNEDVTAKLTSSATDLNEKLITWTLNGIQKISKIGEKNFKFKTGNYGQTSIVNYTVKTDKGMVSKTLRVKPSDVDIVWEVKGYTPPFYRGKKMYARQSLVVFTAFPHIIGSNGAEISPDKLVYKWRKNGSVVSESSGYGKNTFKIDGQILQKSLNISVEVSGLNDEVAKGSVGVIQNDPLVIFYEKSPLLGIKFEKALTGNVIMQNKEIAVVASPYNFGETKSNSTNLNYEWFVNNKKINTSLHETSQTFRVQEETVGSSNISLHIKDSQKFLQTAKGNFQIQFGKNTVLDSGI